MRGIHARHRHTITTLLTGCCYGITTDIESFSHCHKVDGAANMSGRQSTSYPPAYIWSNIFQWNYRERNYSCQHRCKCTNAKSCQEGPRIINYPFKVGVKKQERHRQWYEVTIYHRIHWRIKRNDTDIGSDQCECHSSQWC